MRRVMYILGGVWCVACHDVRQGVPEQSRLAIVTDVTASHDNVSAVTVSWSAPNGKAPTGYVVRRDGVDLVTLPSNQTRFDDLNAQPGSIRVPSDLRTTSRSDAIQL